MHFVTLVGREDEGSGKYEESVVVCCTKGKIETVTLSVRMAGPG
jgi:hypothetical protein